MAPLQDFTAEGARQKSQAILRDDLMSWWLGQCGEVARLSLSRNPGCLTSLPLAPCS